MKYVLGQRISERRVDRDAAGFSKVLCMGNCYYLSFCSECGAGDCKRVVVYNGGDPTAGADDMDWLILIGRAGGRLSGKIF